MNTTKKLLSHDTIFVFDLHGVIFKLSIIQSIYAFLCASHKIQLLSTLFYPHIFFNLFFVWRSGGIIEQYIINLPKQYPHLAPCITDILSIINAQKPIKQTIAIIQHLKCENKKIFVLSNNGEESIALLQKKYPDIFSLFDGMQYANQKNNYLYKPNPAAFNFFCKQFNCLPKQIILIDDNMQNVKSAQALGMRGIHYVNKLSLAQLLYL